jgi:hypothetical protein
LVTEVHEKAISAAQKALALDENLLQAHKARAMIALAGEWDVAKAQLHFERAGRLRALGYRNGTYFGDKQNRLSFRVEVT